MADQSATISESEVGGAYAERYSRNIAALLRSQPLVAKLIDDHPFPKDARPTVGRDGTHTFLIAAAGERPRWFGGSSMPTISAAEGLSGFSSQGTNAILPGILTGYEPIVLAESLPKHAAVFVVEDNPGNVKLAMHLHSYVDLIKQGRLIMFVGDRLVEMARAFFESHPGYEFPTTLVKTPHLSPTDLTHLHQRIETACTTVNQLLTQRVESATRLIAVRQRKALPDAPRIAALGIDPCDSAIHFASRVRSALERIGWPHAICVPDSPQRCHVVARLETVRDIDADVVVMLSGFPGTLRPLLPDGLPVISWFGPDATIPSTWSENTGPCDQAIVCTTTRKTQLKQLGFPSDRIHLGAIAVGQASDATNDQRNHVATAKPVDVAVIARVPDDRPQSSGVTLHSHLQLWGNLQTTITKAPERYNDDKAESSFDRAEQESGTRLTDSKLRESLIVLLKAQIAPACIKRAYASAAAETTASVGLWGFDGSQGSLDTDSLRGPAPAGQELLAIIKAARVVVLLDESPWSLQIAADALAADKHVALLGSMDSLDLEYPYLTTALQRVRLFQTRKDLARILAAFHSNETTRADGDENWRAEMSAKLSVDEQLRQVIRAIQKT